MFDFAPGYPPDSVRDAGPGDSPVEGDSRDDDPPDDDPSDDPPDDPPDDEGSETDFSLPSTKLDDPDVEPSPWVALLDMLDATDPESCPDDRPVTPDNKAEGAHALELRAESIRLYAECGAERTGERDHIEVGHSDDNRDIVAGRDEVAVDGMLDEHTGHGLVHIADEVEMNVGGPLRKQASLEDNIIMAGVMRDEFGGGTLVTAAMSDDLAAGLGLRCTAPLDLWVHGLTAMEERPGTCAADVLLCEFAGTLYEREYGPSAHVAAVARYQGTVATTMKTGFRPLFKTALGVRNLIPGGGGGGGSAHTSPPAAPPAAGGDAAGAATLATVESGGALGRGAAGSGDADEIVSVVRTAESASDATDVENLQHPATTADNLDALARVEAEGGGTRQVAEVHEQPVPAGGWLETEYGERYAIGVGNESLHPSGTLDGSGSHQLGDAGPDAASPLASERRVAFVEPDGVSPAAAGDVSPPASGAALADSTPPANFAGPASTPATPKPKPLELAEPGTAEFDFGKSYHSLRDRQQYYREYTKWPANQALTESIGAVDGKAADLFQGLGGSLDDLPADSTSRTLAIRAELDVMAMKAEAAGDADRLARIRGGIDELDVFVHNTAADIAARADNVPGQTLGSQRVPFDADIDTDKLRSWLEQKLADADARMAAAPDVPDTNEELLAGMLIGDEKVYYSEISRSLEKGENPLTKSREMIAFHRQRVDEYYHSFVGSAAATGHSAAGSAPQQPLAVYKLNLYNQLEALFVAKFSDPQFLRSAAVTDVDLLAPHARITLGAGLDLLEPDSLRLAAGHEIPPPLPAPGSPGHARRLDDVRNASFSRSALEASEATLVRRALDFGGVDVPGPIRQSSSGADSGFGGTPATSPGFGRTPPDNALPPIIEGQSGRWLVGPNEPPGASPAASRNATPRARHDGTLSKLAAVSWDTGLQRAGDSEASTVRTGDSFEVERGLTGSRPRQDPTAAVPGGNGTEPKPTSGLPE